VEGHLQVNAFDIPVGPPPFAHAWYEYKHSSGKYRGSYVYSVLAEALADLNPIPLYGESLTLPTHWIQFITSFYERVDGGFEGDNSCLVSRLDSRSNPVGYSMIVGGRWITKAEEAEIENTPNGHLASWMSKGIFALFFQGLLNCKNVETDEITPPPRLSRKHARRHGGLPYVRYHTLKIRVPGTKTYVDMEAVRRATQDPVPLGLHLVRGHFKTYTAEHGLFGRIAGTFYWPPALRGSLAAGAVGKHYEEQPQKDANG